MQFNLVGPDLEQLTDYSEQIIDKLREQPGLWTWTPLSPTANPSCRPTSTAPKPASSGCG